MKDKSLVCIEFYADSLCEELVGALDIPRCSQERAMRDFGRALCRFRSLDAVEAKVLDRQGEEIDRATVWRK